MKFTLTIELGNDAMVSRRNVSDALKKAARAVVYLPDDTEEERDIMDDNGNSVGDWHWLGVK